MNKFIIDNMIEAWFHMYHEGQDKEKLIPKYLEEFLPEEMEEYRAALAEDNIIEQYDALGDIYWEFMFVKVFTQSDTTRTEVELELTKYYDMMGENFIPIMLAIIVSNYSKTKAHNASGKVTKGESYVGPMIEKLVDDWSKVGFAKKDIVSSVMV